jgi:hypothetical protein
LRFTNIYGNVLDYWIESVSGTTPNQVATIWVKFDSINNAPTTFYMYYGNGSAPAYSNGTNTFIFFDDFLGNSLNTDVWWQWGVSNATVSNGIVSKISGSILTAAQYGANYRFRARSKAAVTNPFVTLLDIDAGTDTDLAYISTYTDGFRNFYGYNLYNNVGEPTDLGIPRDNNWHLSEIDRNGSTSVIYSFDNVVHEDYLNVFTQAAQINFGASSGANSEVNADWVFVAKYSNPEPTTYGAWGSEESSSGVTPAQGVKTRGGIKFRSGAKIR